MKKIKRRLKKVVPRKLRNSLVKKVTLHHIEKHLDHLSIHLLLKNFLVWNPSSKLNVTLFNGELDHSLDFDLEKGHLEIKVPYPLVRSIEGSSKIHLTFNGKSMIIEPEPLKKRFQNAFILDGRFINISAKGKVSLTHRFSEYRFNNDNPARASRIETDYQHLEMAFDAMNDLSGYSLAFMYSNKIMEIRNTSGNPAVLLARDFAEITKGRAAVYLLKDSELTPVVCTSNDILTTMDHELVLKSEADRLHVEVSRHEVELRGLEGSLEGGDVLIRFSYDAAPSLARLVVTNIKTAETIEVPIMGRGENEAVFRVPLHHLAKGYSRKSFRLETGGEHPIRLWPRISNLDHFGFGGRTYAIYAHEEIRMWFYRRKDGMLGFKVRRPSFKREITDVEGFRLTGYISGQEAFPDSGFHLSLLDRHTQEGVRMRIGSEFDIDLKDIDLNAIKSKDKSIIDAFVEIVHSSGETVRKMKIKYRHSDYRKDNYYGKYEITDDTGNLHHHLITTTPYDNLKIESFMIPSVVDIPEDTSRKDKNTWLLGERYDTAQDNGYALFEWLKANTDVEAYYVIEDDSKDYQKIKDEKNVLAFGSKKHFEIAFKAKVLLGTHDLENLLPYKTAMGFFHYEDTVKIFLQHGILGRKRAQYDKKYYEIPFDVFIVSSNPEKYDVVMKKMGYDEEDVAVTGLARFDFLPLENETKDILLMPTWRDWINTDDAFLSSQYYERYYGLIHNERLTRILEENNVRLNFYPHYRAQSYFNDENFDLSDNIRFIGLGEETVQQLLIDHALLITDYSSVSYDFSLMGKPVVYYHFDAQRFFQGGILRPRRETFIGDIAKKEEDLVDFIEEYIRNGFSQKDVDLSGIFEYQDHDNRRRIYETVMKEINASGN